MDMNTIRAILQRVGDLGGGPDVVGTADLCSDPRVHRVHLDWLHEKGFTRGLVTPDDGGSGAPVWDPTDLTPRGREYLAGMTA